MTGNRGKLQFKYMNQYIKGDSLPILKLIPDKSVDLVFTSLPDMSQTTFNIEDFTNWQAGAVLEFARVVKDDGFIVISQQDRKVNGAVQCNHGNYIVWLTRNGFALKDEKIIIRNKPERIDLYKFTFQYLSVFTRTGKIPTSKRCGQWLQDIIIDHEDNVAHQYIWSQKFCSMVIETLTNPFDFVIDPFAGYGPVLYAAKQLNRYYWGGEYEESRYNKDFAYFKTHPEHLQNVWL